MKKIKINKLPEGFEIVDNKVVKKMQYGGMSTGDQFDYGLVTYPTSVTSEQMSDDEDVDVRYSLSSVPREEANIEAEGGETVLTDLNNDGNFGLYDIKGPRHSKGGVPMFLPEQSFIFSDTNSMKMKGGDLKEFGINSRKSITPAKISKRFPLNQFYGAMEDEYADDIQVASAEIMLAKNKMNLSKLAFGQEASKNFEEGLPKAAYGYVDSIGQNPEQLALEIDNMNKQKAMMKALNGLPPKEQQEILALQQFMAQAQQMQQSSQQIANGAPMPPSADEQMMMAQQSIPGGPMSNGELPMAQVGTQIANQPQNTVEIKPEDQFRFYDPPVNPLTTIVPRNTSSATPVVNSPTVVNPSTTASGSRPSGQQQRYQIYSPGIFENLAALGIDLGESGIGATEYSRIQSKDPSYQGSIFGSASENLEGLFESWKDIYPQDKLDKLKEAVSKGIPGSATPEVKEFQTWINNTYIPEQAKLLGKGDSKIEKQTIDYLKEAYGFNKTIPGQDIDALMGTFTSSLRPLTMKEPAPTAEPEVKAEDPIVSPVSGDVGEERMQPNAEFWKQDMLKLQAINERRRRLGLPYQPMVERIDIDYVLEDPTRAVAAINEQMSIANIANNMFAGPQAGSAKAASMAGKSMGAVANAVGAVQNRNVGTVNRGEYQQAMVDASLNREQRDRRVKLFDDTETVLQRYMDEKNYDREQYADAYANAITNRANTFNLNSIQDYYQIDPTSGGMIGQFSSKAFDPVQQTDRMEQYFELATNLKQEGIEPTGDLLKFFTGQSTLPQQTNIQRAYGNNSMGLGIPPAKKGKEMKKYATPFYTGKVGI